MINVIGDVSILRRDCVAIVGARNASANARRFTETLACDLGKSNYIIVSGLARCIDTAAHKASLQSGTVVVLAGGLDEVYPQENTDLYHEIVQHGCVVSEMPLGTKPTSHHFPRRNRIVSGLCKGTVIVEASLRSGSLITARFAAEQGRDVFAVPGFPGDPRAAGPNNLIRDGAKLIQNADDIVQDLLAFNKVQSHDEPLLFDGIAEDFTPFEYNESAEPENNLQDIILDHMSHSPIHVDDLIRICTCSAGHIQTILLDMELAGLVHRHPGNRVSKAA